MKFSARIFIFLFLSLALFLSLPRITSAATATPTSDASKPSDMFAPSFDRFEDDEINCRAKENQSKNTSACIHGGRVRLFDVSNVVSSGIVLLGGWGPKAQASGYFDKRETAGAIGYLAQAINTIYANPPASGLAWLGDTLTNAGLMAKPTYAQGIGFAGLTPLLSLWKTARNISYSVLIIIMVAIGFMIIFRAKIDPKTVISLQAALPKIILTLILITFSYAIAGFMIDLMYLSMAIVINMLASAIPKETLPAGLAYMTNATQQQTEFITGGWLKLVGSVFNFSLFIPLLTQGLLGGGILNIGGLGVASVIGSLVGAAIGGATGTAVVALTPGAAIPVLIILFVIFLGLLFTLFRLTFLLINAYIQVLISVILGPLLLLKEAIPGQSAFSGWIQNLLANLIVFPATVAVIYFSWIMTAVAWKGSLWGAPLIPMGGGGNENGNPLAIFMGMSVIFLAPNLVASIKKVFHAKPAVPITSGSAFSPVTGGAQTAMGAASQFYYMKQIIGGEHGQPSRGTFSGLWEGAKNVLGKRLGG